MKAFCLLAAVLVALAAAENFGREPSGTNAVAAVKPVSGDPLEIAAENPFARVLTDSQGRAFIEYRYSSGTNGAGVANPPVIQINARGAKAQNGRHTVEFNGNLNREDAILVRLLDGQIIRGRPAALGMSDGAGNRGEEGCNEESPVTGC